MDSSTNTGGEILHVAAGSLGSDLGLRPGDRLISMNGHPVRDVLDAEFHSAEGVTSLEIKRGGEMLKLLCEPEDERSLGLEFGEASFDGLRRCRNNCFFCFIAGMPRGLRRGLYLKDDDYRHSFLFGNFVTLTNLKEDDWARLAEQRLSPLYVSVHATDPALRRRMLGNASAPDILAQLRRLADLRIQIHAQIVLCPGVNDGEPLRSTLTDLLILYPAMQSIAVVPVGMTRYNIGAISAIQSAEIGRRGRTSCEDLKTVAMRPFTEEECRAVLQLVREFQRHNRQRHGESVVHLADEFYLRLGEALPPGAHYDGYPQYANGIGMARSFVDEWKQALRLKRRLSSGLGRRQATDLRVVEPEHDTRDSAVEEVMRKPRVAVVTGTLFAPLLTALLSEVSPVVGVEPIVLPTSNRFLGPTITVAGLLTGQDVITDLRQQTFDLAVLPRTMLDADGAQTLDGYSPDAIAQAAGLPIKFAGSPRELVSILRT